MDIILIKIIRAQKNILDNSLGFGVSSSSSDLFLERRIFKFSAACSCVLQECPNSPQGCYLGPHTSPQASISIRGKQRSETEKVKVHLVTQTQQVGDQDP